MNSSPISVQRSVHGIISLLAAVLALTAPRAGAFSPFYEWTEIAKTGMTDTIGRTVTRVRAEASVNDSGRVALVASSAVGDAVLVGDGVGPLRNVTMNVNAMNFDYVMINNDNDITFRSIGWGRMLINWVELAKPGIWTHLADNTRQLSQLTVPMLADGQIGGLPPFVAFLGRDSDNASFFGDSIFGAEMNNYFRLYTAGGNATTYSTVSNLTGTQLLYFRGAVSSFFADPVRVAASYGRYVPEDDGRIVLFEFMDAMWEARAIASSEATMAVRGYSLGRFASISNSGKVVAFGGGCINLDEPEGSSLNPGKFGVFIYLPDAPAGAAEWVDEPLCVWSDDDSITYNDTAAPIRFAEFDFRNAPVAVIHDEFEPEGLIGDVITLAFVATPSEASRLNPAAATRHLQFTDKKGIWTLRVRIVKDTATGEPRFEAAEPIPVMQVGTVVEPGKVVVDLQMTDPLAAAYADTAGHPRTPSPGDHFIAFTASVDTNGDGKGDENRAFRGALMDTDEDGLLDHWERSGIDITGDRVTDLDLAPLGADPMHKDVFLQVDWPVPRRESGVLFWQTQLTRDVAEQLVTMFANAPVTNPDGTTGITLHVDAGPPSEASGLEPSANMGTNPADLQGGEKIEMLPDGSNLRPDVIYMGYSGGPDGISCPGLAARDFHRIKDQYFGRYDRRARELAFRYCVLTDFCGMLYDAFDRVYEKTATSATANTLTADTADFLNGVKERSGDGLNDRPDIVGCGVKITSGTGAGQLRSILAHNQTELTVSPDWSVQPDATSVFVLLAPYVGGQEERVPAGVLSARPGNDLVVALGPYEMTDDWLMGPNGSRFRIIAHQLGRTLGLVPGGLKDRVGAKPPAQYQSLMNFNHLFDDTTSVASYAGPGDPTFDDWGNLQLEFFHNTRFIGNSFEHSAVGRRSDSPPAPEPDEPLPPPAVVPEDDDVDIDTSGIEPPEERKKTTPRLPRDRRRPTIVIVDPDGTCSTTYGTGSSVTVKATAADNVALRNVRLLFDLNGDGLYSGDSEVKTAVYVPGTQTWDATFTGVSGSFGTRNVVGYAYDTSGNRGVDLRPCLAGGAPADAQTLLSQTGTFAAQSAMRADDPRQKATFSGIAVPGSGILTFTVTSTPPIPVAAGQVRREDARVATIRFGGTTVPLFPVGTPPAATPAICTSAWRTPVGGGTVDVELLGPAVYNAAGQFLAHPAQDYTILVRFEPRDFTQPVVTVTKPGSGGFVGLTQDLVIEATVTDDYGVTSVTLEFDRNGDGDVNDAGESVGATALGGNAYRATFAAVSGTAGTRRFQVKARDASGHATVATAFVEVKTPDTTPPAVTIQSPAAASTFRFSDTITVDLLAGDNAALSTVTVAFDLNGDGDTGGAGESVTASLTGPGTYQATFTGLSGTAGARVITATARDSSGNQATNSIPVTIAGVTFTEQTLRHLTGTFPAAWGRQELDWGPVTVPFAGSLRFVVTSTPTCRWAGFGGRWDAMCTQIVFAGEAKTLTAEANVAGDNPAVFTSTYSATTGGVLSGKLYGPLVTNFWGEWDSHAAQDYVFDVVYLRVDKQRPTVSIASPARGSSVSVGSNLVVDIAATDDTQLASVMATFDIDGDGVTTGPGENQVATLVSPGVYRATFTSIQGAPGARRIEAVATDAALNKRSAWMSFGVDGAGVGETLADSRSGTIPPQGWGATRVVTPYGPVTIPRSGRVIFRVVSSPNVRQAATNLTRYDSMVQKINFNGQDINLSPVGNAYGSDPAILESTWDAPTAGTLTYELLGPAVYNIWGEFDGHGGQSYTIEVLFIPGPSVTQVTPNTGSVGGGLTVTVLGAGFGGNAVVLFGEIPAKAVQRVSGTELKCLTPPGVAGPVTVRVLNNDTAGQTWNYGKPYSLFGDLASGFTYEPFAPVVRGIETLVTTAKGFFAAVGYDQGQRWQDVGFTVPAGGGWLHFVTFAFVPILNPIPGPYEDPSNLWHHNESTRVTSFTGGNGGGSWLTVSSSDLNFPFGPVICESWQRVSAAQAGAGSLRLTGPAIWNAFYRQFGEYVMEGAPAQNWSTAVWFSATDATLTQPTSGLTWFSGTVHPVTWTAVGTDTAAVLYFSSDGGAQWTRVSAIPSLRAGTFSWTVPPQSAPRSNCLLKLDWACGYAVSPSFTVAPNVGSLRVTLAPPAAVPSGGRWRVDGGTWQLGDATLGGLAPGQHTISFRAADGYTSPPNQDVTIVAGQTATATGTYTTGTATGALLVSLGPAEAVAAGAQWCVDGGAWQTTGTTVGNLAPGAHTVSFKALAGWSRPPDLPVTITAGQTATGGGSYTAAPTTGALTVTLSPAGAIAAGAQWRVDGGAWQNSGVTIADLAAGAHTVSFKAVAAWTPPADLPVTITAGQTLTRSGSYTVTPTTGALRVNLTPPEAGAAGAQWRRQGTAPWFHSGAAEADIAAGPVTIEFREIAGWTKPANRDATITTGQTTTVTEAYTSLGPPNDYFANRIPIMATALRVTGTNVFATKEPDEPNHGDSLGGSSVWWSWTAPVGGIVTISTEGSSFDTVLGVYIGSAMDALMTIAGNDNFEGMTSEVRFTAFAGSTYQIAVDGFGQTTGDIVLTVTPASAGPTAPSKPNATSIQTSSITWTWQDNSTTETGFKVWADSGAGAPATLRTTTAAGITSWAFTALAPNQPYSFQVAATNAVADSARTSRFTCHTAAAVPRAPTVGARTGDSTTVGIGAGDGNPASTTYAIGIDPAIGGSYWVQADGTVGNTSVWQTAVAWGTTAVTGLTAGTTYSFAVRARNGDGLSTVFGPSAGSATRPDFVVTQIRLDPPLPGVGSTFTAYVRVKNNGTLTGKVGTVGLWLDRPGTDVAVKFKADKTAQSSVGLRPGQSLLFVFSGLAAGPVAAQKTLRAFADAANATVESSESNNQGTLVYNIQTPDFTVTAISITPDYLDCGKTFMAYVTVRNAGSVAGNADFLDVWLNPAAPKTAAATNKGDKSASVGVLLPGQSKRITVTGLKAGLANGQVQALIDSRAKTAESNEANNSLTVDYLCQP